ncbi:MAG: carbon-nitrogen hydrolase family protein [Acidobacteriia bacterium]|nr:carbon-nitrogen hydrolase family protein [Terriglobia bacterium]
MRFKVALLQIAPCGIEPHTNLEKGLDCCRQAKALGADLVVFPELWSSGGEACPGDPAAQRRWTASAVEHHSTFLSSFASLARDLQMNVAITYLEASNPKPRNSVSIFNNQGGASLHYSKACICDFGPDGENAAGCDLNCSPGESFDVCTLTGAEGKVNVGAMICADREFPEPATQLMLNGAELIVVPNSCDWDEVRSAGLLTRAVENLLGVGMANYPRPKTNGNSRAYSCVTWRNGKPQSPLVAAAGEDEELLIAEFDLDEIHGFRRFESWRLNHRYRLSRDNRYR